MSDFLDNVLARSSATPLQIAPRPISRFEPLAAGAMPDIAAPNNDRDRDDAEQLTAESTGFMPTSRLQRQSSQPSFSQPPLLQPELTLRLDSLRVAPIQPDQQANFRTPLIAPSQPQIDSPARAAIQPAVVAAPNGDYRSTLAQPVIVQQPTTSVMLAPRLAESSAPSIEPERYSPTASPNVSVTPLVETHSERVIIKRVVPAERALNTERDQPPMPVLLPAPPVSTTSRALAVAPAASDPAVPSITVTIGRIEVRALPPAPAPTQRQRTTPPVLSLDDYLRQRNGSKQ